MVDRTWSWRRGLGERGLAGLGAVLFAGCSTTTDKPIDSITPVDAGPRVNWGVYDATTPTPTPETEAAPPPSDAAADSPPDVNEGPSCEAGETICGGGCTNTQADPSNCGQCANACGMTLLCFYGQCNCDINAGQSLCNDTCVVTATDENNCGACGHSCQGSMCVGGLCQPTIVANPSGSTISDIAVDETNVYWTQVATSTSVGAVSWKPFATTNAMTDVVSSQDNALADPRGIRVDNTNIYWVDLMSGSVEAWSKVTNGRLLLRFPVADGGASDSPVDITSDGTNVYWVTYDGGEVISAPIGVSDGPLTIIAQGEAHPHAITCDVNGANVYWVDYGDPNSATPTGFVKQAPKTGSSTPITLSMSEDKPWDVAVDDTHVYWTNLDNPGTVKMAPKGGGAVTTLAENLGTPYGIAVDPDDNPPPLYIYWTNFSDNTVMRLPKSHADAGEAPFVLASGQANPAAIAVLSNNIYWVNQGASTILKVAK
jgi:hypothetical protein